MRGHSAGLMPALFLAMAASHAEDRHNLDVALDLSLIGTSAPFSSWVEEGEGKLRFDDDHEGLRFSRAFMDYRGRLTDTLDLHVVANVHDGADRWLDVTEAFVEWRPVPRTPWKFRARAGAFYPRVSLENVDAGWSSAYALSASAINTWIGEELRTVGVEGRVSRALPELPFSPELGLEAAVFVANDPTGALLNWRGWALHDRQTGLRSRLPLPETPAIEPWVPVPDDPRGLAAFAEIDGRPGAYVGADWKSGASFRVKLFHYNNFGDPAALDGLEYAWETRFNHASLGWVLPGDVGLLAQWMDGVTRMGPDLGPWHVWDSNFDARYLLLTRAVGRHRLSARIDGFDVRPTNDSDRYTNRDKGTAWMVAWLFDWRSSVRIGAEYLAIATKHCEIDECAWIFNGLPRSSRQSQWQLTLRLRFRT